MHIAHLFERMCFEARDKGMVINEILKREKVTTFGYANGYSWPDILQQAKPNYLVGSLLYETRQRHHRHAIALARR